MVNELLPAVETPEITPIAKPETEPIEATGEARACFANGVAALERQDYEAAVEAFQQVIEHKQGLPVAWFNKG